jgi:hypothetical protein
MASVMARSAGTTMGTGRPGAATPSRLPLTLADLITAIQDVVGPEDGGLVVATVRHLLGAGRLMRLENGPIGAHRSARRKWGKKRWSRHAADDCAGVGSWANERTPSLTQPTCGHGPVHVSEGEATGRFQGCSRAAPGRAA